MGGKIKERKEKEIRRKRIERKNVEAKIQMNKRNKHQFIFTLGNHELLKGPVSNPFTHTYFGD